MNNTGIMRMFPWCLSLILFVGLLMVNPALSGGGDISPTDKYAWSEDNGWVNFSPAHGGVTVHATCLSGYAWAENIGWISLGDSTGGHYKNDSSSDWGVNMDAQGLLSGYAWSENAGWISFKTSYGQVAVDLNTGSLDGYAWGENVGWIHFRNDSPAYNVATTDMVAPTGMVTINSDDVYTTATAVTLNLTATDITGVTGYYASESSTAPSSGDAGWKAVTSTTGYSEDVLFGLSGSDGPKTVYVWYKDAAGNLSSAASDTITQDTAAPAISSKSPADGATGVSASSAVTAGFSESMQSATITSSTFTVNNGMGNISGSVSYSGTTATFTPSAGLSSYTNYTVTITTGVKDVAGNAMAANATWGFTTADTAAPGGLVIINGNAAEATSTTVTLNLSATDAAGVTGYYASETSTAPSLSDAGWTLVTPAAIYSANVPFTLGSGDGAKTVYVWYRDAAGNVSGAASDSIMLKEFPVVSSFQIDAGAAETKKRTVTLYNTATVNPTHCMASESPVFAGAVWSDYAEAQGFTLGSGSGIKTVYFKVKNAKGESLVVSDTITLNQLPECTSFKINNGEAQTASRTVTLHNTATGSPTGYIASESPLFNGAVWYDYSVAPGFTLSAGQGEKTVYCKVRNDKGESAVVSDVITFNPLPEVSSFRINNGEAQTASRTVTLDNTATASPTHYMASESSGFAGAGWLAYADAPDFKLGAGDGVKTVYFKVKNAKGESSVVSDAITLSPLPEVSSFKINDGEAQTASRTVTLNNTATASPTHYMASESSGFAGAGWLAYADAPDFKLGAGDGVKTVYFKVKNAKDESTVVSDTITLSPLPEVSSFKINDGAAQTASRTVTLHNTAMASPTHYMASESSGFAGAGWQTYAVAPDFLLSTGDGAKTVYLKVKNAKGESAVIRDEITLMEVSEVSSFQINNDEVQTASRTVTLNNVATASPTEYMASENSLFTGAGWKTYAVAPNFLLSTGDGAKTVYLKVKNAHGESTVVNDKIKLMEVPVVTELVINNEAVETASRMVTLNNAATGSPTEYMASENSLFTGARWQSYAVAPAFALSVGDGAKTVYFKVKNDNGVSAVLQDDITLREIPAVAAFKINNGASETASRTVTLNNTARGSPTHYLSSEDSGFIGASWQTYAAAPGFMLSAGKGVKTVYFKVKNANGESPVVSDTITLKKAFAATVADAGIDQLARRGSVITLDGSRSFSHEENVPLEYEWSFVSRSSGIGSLLSDPKSANPTFILKRQGRCEIRLIVKDSLGMASEPDTVIISTKDAVPVACAGEDQSIREAGTRVMLNGAQSYGLDGGDLVYQWAFISRPAESAASLENADTASPAFVADALGDYVIQLTVTDGQGYRSFDTVTASFGNVRPIAKAGKSLSVAVGDTITLAGDGTDANGDVLNYRWALSSLPDGSLSELADVSARVTSFTPDRAGVYVAQLVVSDGNLDSEPGAIQIQAFTTQTKTIAALQGLEAEIAELDSGAFRNADMQNLLLNKLNAVIANVEAGKHADAANQLRNDILPKMGGAENAEGSGVVWITGSSLPPAWYQEMQDLVGALEMAR